MDHQPTILVIDDEPIVCKSCQRILSDEDYNVVTSNDPVKGYQQAINKDFDLVLLDLKMEKMDGIKLLSELRIKKPEIPVIIITGYPSKESKEESFKLNVSDYITKPFMPHDILEPIRNIISNPLRSFKEGVIKTPEIAVRVPLKKRLLKKPTAIYFLHDDLDDNKDGVDIKEIEAYVQDIKGIQAIWHSPDLPLNDVYLLADKIKENNLERVVIAGNTPGSTKNFFKRAMLAAGNDPKDVILASFKDYGAIYKSNTDRAKIVLLCALYGLFFDIAIQPDQDLIINDTLVIGGGIAGIQASLEVANSGNKVYLVEKSATIGGHMAKFDKTFPTMDCAACILTPKMSDVGQHPNIELMTYCEVTEISGEAGNFTVKILKKARYVNVDACTGCGTCATKCPTKIPSEFDEGTALRKAIYIPFPQAVPNKYLIDAENCRYMHGNKCGACLKACPVNNCINLDDKDEEIEIRVGNIIIATGFKPFDAKRIDDLGYGKYPNVLTSLEFERLLNASGPTSGKIKLRTKDKRGYWIFTADSEEPASIAIIHCVGSRDIHYNQYCSRVCCMYSLKLAHLVKEKLPEASVYEYYIDIRAFGKGYDEFFRRIENEGTHLIRGRPVKIKQVGDQLLLRSEDIEHDSLIERKVDMVILSVGLEPSEDISRLSQMSGIPTTEDGWFMEVHNIFDPVNTYSGGIMVAGACQGPKDIPATVAQASAAASRVIQNILKKKTKKGIAYLPLEEIEDYTNALYERRIADYERNY